MSDEALLAQLKSDLGYMFAGPGYFGLHRGWVEVFDTLCRSIDAILATEKRGFRWTTVKEKYGSARFYFELDGRREVLIDLHQGSAVLSFRMGSDQNEQDVVRNSIIQFINDAQRTTETRCAVCGKAGQIKRQAGWLICVCEAHARMPADDIRVAASMPWNA